MDAVGGTFAQLNVRLPRDVKERGDATPRLVGSSPSRMVRQLWERLASGGDAYERIAQALASGHPEVEASSSPTALERSTSLFEAMGAAMGLDVTSFAPSTRSELEMLEEAEWERLGERES